MVAKTGRAAPTAAGYFAEKRHWIIGSHFTNSVVWTSKHRLLLRISRSARRTVQYASCISAIEATLRLWIADYSTEDGLQAALAVIAFIIRYFHWGWLIFVVTY